MKLNSKKKLSNTEAELKKSVVYKKACISASNVNKIILAHININLIRNKFDSLFDQITCNVNAYVHRN